MDGVRFLFETSVGGGYVGVVGDSALVDGSIATQVAGSSNPGICYQVGGGGLNGLFARELGQADQLDVVNGRLRERYDGRFGTGTWAEANRGLAETALTSFLVPLVPGIAPVGERVGALLYSVGPVLGPDGITDADGYSAIYADGFREVARAIGAGSDLAGVRITMLSTGIYASLVSDADALFVAAASAIIRAATSAAAEHPALVDVAVLINTDDTGRGGNERRAFRRASALLGCTWRDDDSGFDAPAATADES